MKLMLQRFVCNVGIFDEFGVASEVVVKMSKELPMSSSKLAR